MLHVITQSNATDSATVCLASVFYRWQGLTQLWLSIFLKKKKKKHARFTHFGFISLFPHFFPPSRLSLSLSPQKPTTDSAHHQFVERTSTGDGDVHPQRRCLSPSHFSLSFSPQKPTTPLPFRPPPPLNALATGDVHPHGHNDAASLPRDLSLSIKRKKSTISSVYLSNLWFVCIYHLELFMVYNYLKK
jgi:hypothetical protein